MKFRSSYGILGNDQIGSNRFVGLLNGEGEYVLNGNLVSGLAIGGLPIQISNGKRPLNSTLVWI